MADARVQQNVAAVVRKPTSGRAQREGQVLTIDELLALTGACKSRYRDVVPVLALAGLRWGELADLQVGDTVSVPGPGLRLRRAVLRSSGGGSLYVDTLKNNRARTVPLVMHLVPIVGRWSEGKRRMRGCSPRQKAVRCASQTGSVRSAGLLPLLLSDDEGSASTIYVTRRRRLVLGHATAAMTMDLYGHMMDAKLWQAARLVGDISGTFAPPKAGIENEDGQEPRLNAC